MAVRHILCTQCDLPLDVDETAKSVNCRHCNTRVITEAMVVAEYVAVRRFATANRMRITKKGIVYASVRADALEVEGVLQGDVVSLTSIRITKSAQVKGSLRGASLSLEPGATFVGDVAIGPEQVPTAEATVDGALAREAAAREAAGR